jgi:flagellar protein FliS
MVAALAHHYRDTQVTSASPAQTVLMLYDGAIRFLKSASIELTEKNDLLHQAKMIEKTVNILDYLKSCLDMEKGGEIAANLDRIYEYMMVELTHANLKHDAEKIDAIIKLILPVRDAWAEICKDVNENGKINKANAYSGNADEDKLPEKKRMLIKA